MVVTSGRHLKAFRQLQLLTSKAGRKQHQLASGRNRLGTDIRITRPQLCDASVAAVLGSHSKDTA
jgi:hypothetical protein